ncbi:hypothetical protein NBRC116597_01860 [Phaeobacter sp. NW0010-22]
MGGQLKNGETATGTSGVCAQPGNLGESDIGTSARYVDGVDAGWHANLIKKNRKV